MNALSIAGDSWLLQAAFAIAVTSTGALVYTYFGYPLFMLILGSLFRKPRKEPGHQPSISMLIAAYNEEANIGRKLEQTLALRYPADKFEVLVVSDGSTDRTDEIVRSFADPRVRLLRIDQRKGKTNAQNEGVKLCRGEIIVFSDATATYHPDALKYLACNYDDPRVGAVSGRYKYFDPNGDSPTGLGSVAFWNYENMIKLSQHRVHTLTGCSGCIYSVRKSVYVPLPLQACSDLVEPLHIVRNGFRVAFEDRALAFEETTQNSKEEFRMRTRIVTRAIRGLFSVPELLKPWAHPWVSFQLLSHKVLRWLVPFPLIALYISSAVLYSRAEFRYALFAQSLFYGFALLSLIVPLHRRWKLLGIPLFFCTLNAAALVSFFKLRGGQKYTVWETVRRAHAS
jgi:cellulose synthase/poly-beta-1,6-N-acetylglucosamine synthase-like glycosyltransferase